MLKKSAERKARIRPILAALNETASEIISDGLEIRFIWCFLSKSKVINRNPVSINNGFLLFCSCKNMHRNASQKNLNYTLIINTLY